MQGAVRTKYRKQSNYDHKGDGCNQERPMAVERDIPVITNIEKMLFTWQDIDEKGDIAHCSEQKPGARVKVGLSGKYPSRNTTLSVSLALRSARALSRHAWVGVVVLNTSAPDCCAGVHPCLESPRSRWLGALPDAVCELAG
jgi:hypothetical protein